MGYVMFIMCLASVTFAIVAPEQPLSEAELTLDHFANKTHAAGMSLENDDDLLELTPAEVLNYYLIGAVFAIVGGACFFISWKKEKRYG